MEINTSNFFSSIKESTENLKNLKQIVNKLEPQILSQPLPFQSSPRKPALSFKESIQDILSYCHSNSSTKRESPKSSSQASEFKSHMPKPKVNPFKEIK